MLFCFVTAVSVELNFIEMLSYFHDDRSIVKICCQHNNPGPL